MKISDKESKKTQKKIRPSMIKDRINPVDFNSFKIPMSCEDCSHFSLKNTSCTLGFNVNPHLKKNMIQSFNLSGKVPQCRFLEID